MTFSKNLSFCLLFLSFPSLVFLIPFFGLFFLHLFLIFLPFSLSILSFILSSLKSFFCSIFLQLLLLLLSFFECLSFVPFLSFVTHFSFPHSISSFPYTSSYLFSYQIMSSLNPNGEHNLAHIYFYLLWGVVVGGALQR